MFLDKPFLAISSPSSWYRLLGHALPHVEIIVSNKFIDTANPMIVLCLSIPILGPCGLIQSTAGFLNYCMVEN